MFAGLPSLPVSKSEGIPGIILCIQVSVKKMPSRLLYSYNTRMNMESSLKIGLLPLDERPVNTRYPQMVGRIAGAQVCLPPPETLSHFRQPAEPSALIAWLEQTSPQFDALVASFEMLGYGGLIASRTTSDTAGRVVSRLQALVSLKRLFPAMPVIGFNLITRVSNADSAIEEPLYWAQEGQRFYRFSQLLDRSEQGQAVADELAELAANLPPEHIQDFLQRRLRNHAVNLAALHMAAGGDLDMLVLSSDDTSPYGLPTSEKRSLSAWASRLALKERLLMYPGADEVGTALVARLVNQKAGYMPTFAVYYAVPGGEAITAPYEDGPVCVTVERQIRAVGGQVVEDSPASPADFWVAVNPPVPRRSEWHPAFAGQERLERLPFLRSLTEEIKRRMADGQAVILVDVAYPNGADPALIEVLFEDVSIQHLAAYGAWNTAGNTIGVALAQGCASRLAQTPAQHTAQQRFLLHRFVEDWAYQQVVRQETRQWLEQQHQVEEITPEVQPAALEFIEAGLRRCMTQIPGFTGYTLKAGSVWLPWDRLFEVDFELEDDFDGM
jgi:hypothetical protein